MYYRNPSWRKSGKCYGQGGVDMKSYAIFDEELERESAIGYLFYYEKSRSFVIELCRDLDPWEAPLLFQKLVSDRQYTVPRDIALMWGKERIIPSGRQNIGSILKNHKLKEYSEIAMLILAKGRSSQDSCCIKEVSLEQIPHSITARMKQNLWECFPTEDNHLLCMFQDDLVRKIDLNKLVKYYKDLSHVLKNRALLESAKVGPGGYSLIFDDAIELQAIALRDFPITTPLGAKDFYRFACRNIVDTTKACDMLQCSRQNLAYLVKEEKLKPVFEGAKGNLYLKGEIENLAND